MVDEYATPYILHVSVISTNIALPWSVKRSTYSGYIHTPTVTINKQRQDTWILDHCYWITKWIMSGNPHTFVAQ